MNKISDTTKSVMSEWETSKTINGITTAVKVKEVKNGFVVSFSKYGYEDSDVEHGEYISETKEYIATENPLKDLEKIDAKDNDGVKELLNTFYNKVGLITVQ